MDDNARKTALRAIPYGIYVLTAQGEDGTVAAATVNWVTQTSFQPPLVAVGVKADSGICAIIKEAGCFALNMLGKGQQGVAFTFFKPAKLENGQLSGQPIHAGGNGAAILEEALAAIECNVADVVELGDHHILVGEVTEAHLLHAPEGRPDAAILEMKELGANVFYGG